MKTIYLKSTLLLFFGANAVFSQIGVNTIAPTSTLDVVATNATGTTTNVDGLLIPRVDRQRAQSMVSIATSTMIYVNSIATGTATGTTVNVTATGFYYYDGSVWQPIKTAQNSTNNVLINQFMPTTTVASAEGTNIGTAGFLIGSWTTATAMQKRYLGGYCDGLYYAPASATLTNLSLTGWVSNSSGSNANVTIYLMKYSLGTAAGTYTTTITGTSLGSQNISAVSSGSMSPVSISVASASVVAGDVLICVLVNNSGGNRNYEFGGQLQFTN